MSESTLRLLMSWQFRDHALIRRRWVRSSGASGTHVAELLLAAAAATFVAAQAA